MKYLFTAFILVSLSACKQSVTKLPAKIIDSDSMAINWFKGDGSMDTVVAVKIIKDKAAINQLAKLAGGYTITNKSCGFDGTLHFFKMDKVIQDIEFRMNDEQCTYFTFRLEGEVYTTEFNAEAKKLLLGMK
jgi:hypothetical protein